MKKHLGKEFSELRDKIDKKFRDGDKKEEAL